MSKSVSRTLVIVIVCGFALCFNLPFGVVQASTGVMGIISSDTTWTQANSPYNLTGNVLVDSGVTLTIEAGATLNSNEYYIRVDGTLIIESGVTVNLGAVVSGGVIQVNGVLTAIGTSANPIHVTGVGYSPHFMIPVSFSSIVFSESSDGWNEQAGSGCIIQNTVFSQSEVTISSSPKVTECTFVDGSEINVYGGSPVISENVVVGVIDADGGSPTISNNNVDGCIAVDDDVEDAYIVDNVITGGGNRPAGSRTCIFFGCDWGGGHVRIERNSIAQSDIGIYFFIAGGGYLGPMLTIQNNTITNNNVGIAIKNPTSQPVTIINNNIYDNTINIELSAYASEDINATYNWWGTTDTQTISELIVDFYDNLFDLGKVSFTPFLTEPNPEAEPIPEFSSWLILLPLLVATLVTVLHRKKLTSS